MKKKTIKMKSLPEKMGFVALDFLIVLVSYAIALFLQYGFSINRIPENVLKTFAETLIPCGLISVLVFASCRIYRMIWKYAGLAGTKRLLIANILSFAFQFGGVLVYCIIFSRERMSVIYFANVFIIQIPVSILSRFIYRQYIERKNLVAIRRKGENVLIYGAGSAGNSIYQELLKEKEKKLNPVGFIDDAPEKKGLLFGDLRVLGNGDELQKIVEKKNVRRILIAIPSLDYRKRKQIFEKCRETGVTVSLLPTLRDMETREVQLDFLKKIQIEDLIEREDFEIDKKAVFKNIQGKTVLITGAAGTIGAEISRQIIQCHPKKLVLFEMDETGAVEIRRELLKNDNRVEIIIAIGSVRDSDRVRDVFAEHKPQLVFHCAGYRQVSLLEVNISEAIKTNIIGTYKTAYEALHTGAEQFILISAEHAVNATSVSGMTKRVSEMIVQTMDAMVKADRATDIPKIAGHGLTEETSPCGKTKFAAVRFGNVLESRGSVVSLFKKQIEGGGPVTVTDPNIVRYFMLARDAVSLILESAAMMNGGEIFSFNIGKPVKIDSLARTMISLSGFEPDEEIKVIYTGLRPGERAYEEKLLSSGKLKGTMNPHILYNDIPDFGREGFFAGLQELLDVASGDEKKVKGYLENFIDQRVEETEGLDKDIIQLEKTTIAEIQDITGYFSLGGPVTKAIQISRGYINRTYYIEVLQPTAEIKKYILQRINTNVFKNPEGLMDNFRQVTEALREDFILPGAKERGLNEFSVPKIIPTKSGETFADSASGAWRVISYYPETFGLDMVENANDFYQAGQAFGAFINAVAKMDATKLCETIPNFHNCPSRYRDLLSSIEKDPNKKTAEVQPEIQFIREREAKFSCIHNALESGIIPKRICHNDTNLNNVLFDNRSHLPVAVIDLDTVMPSSPLYDFGDSMRTGTSTAKDDEKDLTKVQFKVELYEYYARGFLEQCGKALTREELELLPSAALIMTMEDGIRFLADYIDGNIYFQIDYKGQNLDRARTQIKMVAEMEKALPDIKKTLNKIYRELGLDANAENNKGW